MKEQEKMDKVEKIDPFQILYQRFPHIFENILFNLDTNQIVELIRVSKYFKNFITEENEPIKKDIELWQAFKQHIKNIDILKVNYSK